MKQKDFLVTLIVGFVVFSFIPIWIFLIIPQLPIYRSNFSLNAEVASVDNFYNEETKEYQGEKTSKTIFTYETEEKNGTLLIKNTFDVRTLQGEKIFAVVRQHGINPFTGKHIKGFGDHDREGYLFAPKHLQKRQPFTYWHVNYDGPAHMQYVKEEHLFGLTVYKYETNYQGVIIDQTKNLTDLPGVGVTRGVNLDPHLTLWIEPVSGRLVKYQDQTTAYYYDLATGKRLHPWNKFSNSIVDVSVRKLVDEAYAAKATLILQEIVTPLLIAIIGIFLVLRSFFIAKGHWFTNRNYLLLVKGIGILIIFAGIVVIFGWLINNSFLKSGVPGFATMKFPTAIAFILSGFNLYLLAKLDSEDQEIAKLFLPILTFTLALLMTTIVLSSVFGVRTGIENLFFQEVSGEVQTVSSGRPSFGTIFSFILIIFVGIAGFTIKKYMSFILTVAGWIIGSVGLIAFFGYVLDMPPFYYYFKDISTAMAMHTSILLVTYGVSLIILGRSINADDYRSDNS